MLNSPKKILWKLLSLVTSFSKVYLVRSVQLVAIKVDWQQIGCSPSTSCYLLSNGSNEFFPETPPLTHFPRLANIMLLLLLLVSYSFCQIGKSPLQIGFYDSHWNILTAYFRLQSDLFAGQWFSTPWSRSKAVWYDYLLPKSRTVDKGCS